MIATNYRLSFSDCRKLKISDSYGVHKAVYSLFPTVDNETRDFLFAEKDCDSGGRRIIILSKRFPLKPSVGEISSKEIPESFLKHNRYRFETILNPVRRDKTTQKSIAILGYEELKNWFIGKTNSLGFNLNPETLDIKRTGVVQYVNKTGSLSTHNLAIFTGELTVVNLEMFKKCFEKGIGKSKAFGFGLLQIVPVR